MDNDDKFIRTLKPFAVIFADFHPGRRPVLWRILASQYFLFRAIRHSVRNRLDGGAPDDTLEVIQIEVENGGNLCWKNEIDQDVISAARIGYQILKESLPAPQKAAR